MNLPEEIKITLLKEPLFSMVIERCLEEPELIEGFERLSGVNRPPQRRTPIERMVDDVTGYRDDQWSKFFAEFIPFVYRCVWLTWEGRFQESRA